MLILTEEQAYNVIGHEGAVATANTHYTRWLNKEILNTISGASWLYNSGESTFTLPSGTYHVVANTKMHRSGGIQFYVASSVDYTVPLIIGHMMGGSLTSGLEACSAIDGILTTSGATFKLRVKPQYSTSDRAFGVPLESEMGGSNTNFKNYYSTIRITKLA
jgi:hypothetical protein